MNFSWYRSACEIVGLPEPGYVVDGRPIFQPALGEKQQELAEDLMDMAGKPMSYPASQKLKERYGETSSEWQAFIALRTNDVARRRSVEYSKELLGKFIDWILENASTITVQGRNVMVVDPRMFLKLKEERKKIAEEIPD